MARTPTHYPRGSKILEVNLELPLYFRSLGHSLQARLELELSHGQAANQFPAK